MMLTTEEIYQMTNDEIDEWIIRHVMGWSANAEHALNGLFDPEVYLDFPACVHDGEIFQMYAHSETEDPIPFSPSRIAESTTAALDKLVDDQGWTYSILRGDERDRKAVLRSLRWELLPDIQGTEEDAFFAILARRGYYIVGHGPLFPIAVSRAILQSYGKPDGVGFVTSKEILERTGVKSVQTLMKWSELGVLPSARVTAQAKGRGSIAWFPQYTVERVKTILALKGEGYGIRRIKRILEVVEGRSHDQAD